MVEPLVLKPIVRTSAIEAAQEQILALVREGAASTLPPERELAEQLGISRNTVREALRGLADQGLLQARQGAGWFVRPRSEAVIRTLTLYFRLEDSSLEQMTEARNALEPAIVVAATQRRTQADIEELEHHLAAMVNARSAAEFLHADTQFHETLARASGNTFFVLALKPILAVLEETRAGTVSIPGRRERVIEEHRRILMAVSRGDTRAAERAMGSHLDSFAEAAVQREDHDAPTANGG